jgi:anti-sigma regulatory factor (Ser/Thr protein kinase)
MSVSGDAICEKDCPQLELEFERNDEAPSLARAAVLGFCENRALGGPTIATLLLLVSEVVTNAVVHPDADASGRVALRACIKRETVRIEVSDDGRGFTPEPRDPDRPTGGYGLFLVEKEATRWGVERAPRTTVWFELAREAA